jgi:hypothetical protein
VQLVYFFFNYVYEDSNLSEMFKNSKNKAPKCPRWELLSPFGAMKKLVVSLIMPNINYGHVVNSTVDSASQKRLSVTFNYFLCYINDISHWVHVSHLVPTTIGVSLARIHLLTTLFKVLHIRHPSYLFTLFHFAFSARTRNLIVTPHRSLAMGHSFTVGTHIFHI